jgi:hypothetical protein
MRGTLAKALIGTSLLLGASSLCAQDLAGQPSRKERREWEELRDCKPKAMIRCWYLFFGSGSPPDRKLFVADLKARPSESDPNLVDLDVIVVNESESTKGAIGNDFVFYTIQYQCDQKRMRELNVYAVEFDSTLSHSEKPGKWFSDYDQSWYGVAEKIACNSDVQLRPGAHTMQWVGSAYRPIDTVDLIRRYLWKQQ